MNPTSTVDAPTESIVTVLTAADRCDNCGAQAYVQAEFEKGSLLFCAHHFTKSEEKITATAKNIVDERFKLTATKPS